MPAKILVVDDSKSIVLALENYLKEAGYETLSARDGRSGMETLRDSSDDISTVLLDRTMPILDGLGFMRELRADPVLADIPIIMQTGRTAPSEIVEGFEAGVFNYLTKPFSKEVMLSVVKSAVGEFSDRRKLKKQLSQQIDILQSLSEGLFHFGTVEQARHLAGLLATLSPNPERHAMPLTELLVNAVEHGLAGLSYSEKGEFLRTSSLEKVVAERLARLDRRSAKASIKVVCTTELITYTICDGGAGFDWTKYLAIDPDRALDPNGRGVAMAALSCNRLEYQGNGNTVIVSIDRM